MQALQWQHFSSICFLLNQHLKKCISWSTPPLLTRMLPSIQPLFWLVWGNWKSWLFRSENTDILCHPIFGHCPISFNFLYTGIVNIEDQSNMLMFVLKGRILVNPSVNFIIFWYTLTTLSMGNLNHTSGTPHLKRWVMIDIHWPHGTLCIWSNVSSSTDLNR